MKNHKKNLGFTLIELVMTIVIISVLSSLAFINWGKSNSTLILNQQAAILANNLRYTQSLSMSHNERFRLTIISPSNYKIKNSKNIDQEIPGNNLIATLDSDVSFVLPPKGFTKSIIFNGQGIPFTDTNNVSKLQDEAIIILKSTNGQTKKIMITPNTGRISY